MSTQQPSWRRYIIIVVVLAMSWAYLATQMDDLLLSNYTIFSKQPQAQDGVLTYDSDRVKDKHNYKDLDDDEDDDEELDESRSSSDNDEKSVKANNKALPVLQTTDIIYQAERWGNPLVVPEYKLVFFTLPKVACTEWKLLFRRMYGLPEWPEDQLSQDLHNPVFNQLMYISNYTQQEAQEMLTSDEWTRAVFVREPKERVLSAFLNKFVEEKRFFVNKCCQRSSFHIDVDVERGHCIRKKQEGDFVYFLNRTLDCPNPHWNPQVDAIDEKWWKQMSFVGYMHHVADDAERLLKQIYTPKGTSAWDDYGKSGWGSNRTTAFMVRDTAHHATNAHNKLRKYYTPCTEKFVDRNWRAEWKENAFTFTPFQLFNESEYPSDEDCEI